MAEFAPQTATVDMQVSTLAPGTPAVEETSTEVSEVVEGAESTTAKPEETSTEPAEKAESDPEVKESGAEKRIKQLVAKNHEAEQRVALLEKMLETNQVPQYVPEEAPVEPNLDDFESYADWEKANTKYIVAISKHEMSAEIAQNNVQLRKQQLDTLYQARLEVAAVDDPTIMAAASDPTLPVSPLMGDLIKESLVGPKIVKYLSENRNVAKMLYGMHPIQVAREIGKLEYQLSQAQPERKEVEIRQVSQAPTPIKTVTPSGRTTIRDEDLPIEEFMKRRNQKQYKKN